MDNIVFIFGIMGMSMGGLGFVFGIIAFSKIDKLEKKLIENEVLDEAGKSS